MDHSQKVSILKIDSSGFDMTSKESKQHKQLIKLPQIISRGEDEMVLQSQY